MSKKDTRKSARGPRAKGWTMYRITTGAVVFTLVIGTAACSSHDAFEGGTQSVQSAFSIGAETAAEKSFTLFESGQVRPLALSLDGKHLYAANTPDNRLEIFQISGSGLAKVGSVSVGLEPLAVAARSDSEVWVVNHLSDSISIVDVQIAEQGLRKKDVARRRRAEGHRVRRVRSFARLHYDGASRSEHRAGSAAHDTGRRSRRRVDLRSARTSAPR